MRPMARYTVNEQGVKHVRKLIEARQYVLNSDWGEVQPRAEDENAYLERHSWEEYAVVVPRADRGSERRHEGSLRVRVRRLPARAPHRAHRLPLPGGRVASQGDRAGGARPVAAAGPEERPDLIGSLGSLRAGRLAPPDRVAADVDVDADVVEHAATRRDLAAVDEVLPVDADRPARGDRDVEGHVGCRLRRSDGGSGRCPGPGSSPWNHGELRGLGVRRGSRGSASCTKPCRRAAADRRSAHAAGQDGAARCRADPPGDRAAALVHPRTGPQPTSDPATSWPDVTSPVDSAFSWTGSPSIGRT